MSNNREIHRLDELAFEALLRNRVDSIKPRTQGQYEVLMQYKLKKDIPVFLQYIADGNEAEVTSMLEDNPALVLAACGTVTTFSGDTLEDVTAIQLAYLLEDDELYHTMMPYLGDLPQGRERAHQQLAKKIAEVEEQELRFKQYDFNDLITAISEDHSLKNKHTASAETEEALTKFKENFKPGIVKKGRPFNMHHLKDAYAVYCENFDRWNRWQLLWFLQYVIGYLQSRVPSCYAQAFSQGLKKIIDEKQFLKRSFTLKNYINSEKIFYFSREVTPLFMLGRDIYIDIYYGGADGEDGRQWWPASTAIANPIEKLFRTKTSHMERVKQ